MTLAKGLEHGGNGERHQEEPDEDRDVRRFLQEILVARMHHVEVAIDGGDGQEGDAGPPV